MLGDYAASVETTLSNIASAKIGATLLDGAYMNVLTLAPGDGTGVAGGQVGLYVDEGATIDTLNNTGDLSGGVAGGDKPRHHWHAA